MNDNTMLRIIIESNLHIRIMEHFLLIGNQPSLKLDKIQEDNIILSFANQLYEDIVPVLVEEYNKYCAEIIEKKFSQQNKVLGNIEKFAENQGLQTFFFNEKVS